MDSDIDIYNFIDIYNSFNNKIKKLLFLYRGLYNEKFIKERVTIY